MNPGINDYLFLEKSFRSTSSTDMDKIFMQFFLDIEAWGAELEKLGINIQNFTPYIQLLGTVNRNE